MFKKLMWAFTVLIIIGVVITGILSMEIAKNYYYNSIEDRLVSNAALQAKELSGKISSRQLDYESLCREYSDITNERITIISMDGQVLGDSHIKSADMDNHIDRPEVRQAIESGFGKCIRKSGSIGDEMLYVALPITSDTETEGIIRVSILLDSINDIQKRIWSYIFMAIFAGILVAVVLGYRYLYSITMPIKEITNMAGIIAAGKFDKKVQVKTDDEIGELGKTFNYMVERLSDTIKELRNDKSKIEAILTGSMNGVIAVENDGKIMIINPVAEKLLNIREKDVVGKDFFELANNKEISRKLKEILVKKEDGMAEFNVSWPEQKIIRAFSSPIVPKGKHSRVIGRLIIIQDITAIRRLEKLRSDFVANVTHELRTPLTSIKGFVETLKQGAIDDPDTRDRFLEIIDLESDRLKRLIDDILLLSEIENRSLPLQEDSIDIELAIKDDILSIFNHMAQEKNIEIKTFFETGLPVLHMNIDRFKQMMINLIDNAIKYTPDGGEVVISAYSTDKSIVLKVKDTGIGISEEHQKRLFERFYRVDKGRSRKMGGTGLGLAIVKHIVLSINGTVRVSSKPEMGTEFKIEIPSRGEH